MSNTISIEDVAQELRDVGSTVADSIKHHSIKHADPAGSRRWWVAAAALVVAAAVAALVWRAKSGESEVATDGLL